MPCFQRPACLQAWFAFCPPPPYTCQVFLRRQPLSLAPSLALFLFCRALSDSLSLSLALSLSRSLSLSRARAISLLSRALNPKA